MSIKENVNVVGEHCWTCTCIYIQLRMLAEKWYEERVEARTISACLLDTLSEGCPEGCMSIEVHRGSSERVGEIGCRVSSTYRDELYSLKSTYGRSSVSASMRLSGFAHCALSPFSRVIPSIRNRIIVTLITLRLHRYHASLSCIAPTIAFFSFSIIIDFAFLRFFGA